MTDSEKQIPRVKPRCDKSKETYRHDWRSCPSPAVRSRWSFQQPARM